jgi:hypothetical protein
MRSSKVACLVLAALNVAVFSAQFISEGDAQLEARVSFSAKNAKPREGRGAVVPFRLEGEMLKPDTVPSAVPEPASVPVTPPEVPIDSVSFTYLGTMTSPEGRIEYFFKNRATGLVYSAGHQDGTIKVLESTEKEFLIEADGTKYKVSR